MIRLEDILTPGRALVGVPGGSKKRVLEQIAKLVAHDLPDLDSQDVFESLIAREKLGSTGFGNGIAIRLRDAVVDRLVAEDAVVIAEPANAVAAAVHGVRIAVLIQVDDFKLSHGQIEI